MKVATILFAVFCLSGVVPARAQVPFDDPRVLLDPGESLVLHLSRFSREVAVSPVYGHGRSLPPVCREALSLAPAWMHNALFDAFARLEPATAVMLAQTIWAAYDEDPRYVDEVAFAVAHLPPEDLQYDSSLYRTTFDPELLLENVRGIYAADPHVPYARIVEREEGTPEYYTTVVLVMHDGQWEVPRDIYYWYVAHPRLSDDSALYVDPRTGNPSSRETAGRFWRSYFLTEDPEPDYAYPATLKAPHRIDNLGSYSARGGLRIPGADSIVEVAGPAGEEIMIHYAWGRGMLYATTLEVESEPGELAENLVAVGFGHGSVLAPDSGVEILLIRDRDPFFASVVEDILLDQGYAFSVADTAGILDLDSAADLDRYKKVILAGDQPLALYEALEARRAFFHTWMESAPARVFLFLGAMHPAHDADDWSAVDLPFSFERVGEPTPMTGTARGYPTFREMMTLPSRPDLTMVWDGAVHENLSGQRFISDEDIVLDRLGYLVSQNLELNVSEIPPEYRGPDGDWSSGLVRSPWPQRIVYQHYGNCGELQDLGMAFGRTALIPSAGVGGITEDHVWNEFFLLDQWVPFQVSWSDGPTDIAVPGNRQDKDYGGGKDLAIVYRNRPDGRWENVTERYSNTFPLTLKVTDADDRPVSGAEILLASENWYNPAELTLALVTHTDHRGEALMNLGDFQNFYLRVSSPAGFWPDERSVQWIVCEDAAATNPGGSPCPLTAPWDDTLPMILGDVPDVPYEIAVRLEGNLPPPPTVRVEPVPASELKLATVQVEYTYRPEAEKAVFATTLDASHTDEWEAAEPPSAWLFDEANLQLYLAGEAAVALAELVPDGETRTIPVPPVAAVYVAVSNHGSWGSSLYVNLEVALQEYSPPKKKKDSGCSCRAGGSSSPHLPLFVWFLLPGLFVFLRRRLGGTIR